MCYGDNQTGPQLASIGTVSRFRRCPVHMEMLLPLCPTRNIARLIISPYMSRAIILERFCHGIHLKTYKCHLDINNSIYSTEQKHVSVASKYNLLTAPCTLMAYRLLHADRKINRFGNEMRSIINRFVTFAAEKSLCNHEP